MMSFNDWNCASARTTSTFGPCEICETGAKSFCTLYGTLESSGFTAIGPRFAIMKE